VTVTRAVTFVEVNNVEKDASGNTPCEQGG